MTTALDEKKCYGYFHRFKKKRLIQLIMEYCLTRCITMVNEVFLKNGFKVIKVKESNLFNIMKLNLV